MVNGKFHYKLSFSIANRVNQHQRVDLFSRKRSEGFPFIVGGLGVGPVFASRAPCHRNVRVDCRENCRVNCRENSVPIGEKLQTASSSEVSGCPLATPCLWGKLQNASFLKVSKCQHWRLSRRNPIRYATATRAQLITTRNTKPNNA